MRLKPLYTFLKYYVPIGFRIYYRRFQIQHKERVPKTDPVIFAINHQNAFIDPMVIAVTSPRRPWFLTRASIFKSAIARFWLGSLKMLPIYRIRDGIDQVKRNDSAINRCKDLLLEGQTILIFLKVTTVANGISGHSKKGWHALHSAPLKQTPVVG